MTRVLTAAVLMLALAACGQTAQPPQASAVVPVVRDEPTGSSTDRDEPSKGGASPGPAGSTDPARTGPVSGLSFVGIGGQPGGPNGETADGHALLATPDNGLLAGGSGVLKLDPEGRWSGLGAGLDGNVRSLAVAADGTLLAGLRGGTRAGVVRLEPGKTSWESLGEAFAGSPVLSVAASRAGEFAATGDNDVYGWDAAAQVWKPIGPRMHGTLITTLSIAPDGSLIAAGTATMSRPSVYRYKNAAWSEVSASAYLPGSVLKVAAAPDGAILVSVESPDGGGVLRLPPAAERFVPAGQGLPAGTTFEIALSSGGRLVAGAGSGGVFELGPSGWTGLGAGLPAGPVEAVAAGPNSTFARVASAAFALRDGVWQPLDMGLAAAGANAVIATPDRGLLAGTSAGIASQDASGRWTSENANAPGTELLALAAMPDGSVIAGTAWNGVFRRGRDGVLEALSIGLPESATVRSVTTAPDGSAWAAVEATSDRAGGAYRLAAGQTSWKAAGAGLSDGGVTSIAIDAGGRAWAGVNGGTQPGVFVLDPETAAWSRSTQVPEGVSRVLAARDGSILAGSYGAGVRRLDRSTGQWAPFGFGLPGGLDGWVLELEDDLRLGLLAGTSSGLYRLAAGRWEPVDAGLPRAAITDVLRQGERLIVATRASGVFASMP